MLTQAGKRNIFAPAYDGLGLRQSSEFGTQLEGPVQDLREAPRAAMFAT